MDVYGLPSSAADCSFPIDDLLDFSNDELFSSASASASSSDSDSLHLHLHHPHYLPTPLDNPSNNHRLFLPTNNVNAPTHFSTDFTNDLCVPVSTPPSPLCFKLQSVFYCFSKEKLCFCVCLLGI